MCNVMGWPAFTVIRGFQRRLVCRLPAVASGQRVYRFDRIAQQGRKRAVSRKLGNPPKPKPLAVNSPGIG